MWQQLLSLMPRGQFARRVAWLTGGTFLGQLVLVGTMPLLTRLYTPEDFGLFGVFGAINGIFGIVMVGRYEFAIPLMTKDEDAAAVVALGGIVALLLTLISGMLLWAFGDSLAELTHLPALVSLLWLLPPILLLTGLGQLLEYWSIRRNTIRLNGASRIVQYGGQAASQSLLGVAGGGALGLTIGYGIGYLVRLVLFAAKLPVHDRELLRATQYSRIRGLVASLWSYPTYSATSSLLRSATQFLPTILLAALYGPAIAGAFDLAQRILTVPVRLLSGATSQVFLLEAAQRSAPGVLRLFVRAVPRFLLLGFIGMAPLLIAGPWLFGLIFGEPWREAGGFAQALVAYQLSRFVAVPVSQTFNVFGRQDLDLNTALINGLALVASFAVIFWLDLRPAAAVMIYSVSSAASQLVMLWFAWRTTQQAATQHLLASRRGSTEP